MNLFYEDDGQFKVGTIIQELPTALQVETQHGKRSKIKTAQVLVRFNEALSDFLAALEAESADFDLDFIWSCAPDEEFAIENLAKEYFGHSANAVQLSALWQFVHAAPMYFYRKGRGHYRRAPEDTLKAALAGQEKRRQQQEQVDAWAQTLQTLQLPEGWQDQVWTLLHKPDKNSLPYKAMDLACRQLGLAPRKLFEACGALKSTRDYHYKAFQLEYFPRGEFHYPSFALSAPPPLPTAAVQAFSIDDSHTTEIDDAFSVTWLADGAYRVGIHIAAPTLASQPGDALDAWVKSRLSTVYMPGQKIPMLPGELIDIFSLFEGRVCPCLSLYFTVQGEVIAGHETRLEQVAIAANLRLEALDPVFNEHTAGQAEAPVFPYQQEMNTLWALAHVLEALRGKADSQRGIQLDYNIMVDEHEQVQITTRRRGSPTDKVVSELMIYANAHWGEQLALAERVGIYRTQSFGKVKMSSVAGGHQGLGVNYYAWCTSPLRRAADWFNQQQLIRWVQAQPSVHEANSTELHALVRDFDLTYQAYNEFQERMERYWCLRYLQQQNLTQVRATVLRDEVVRLENMPLVIKIPPHQRAPGEVLELHILALDLLDLSVEVRVLDSNPTPPLAEPLDSAVVSD